MATMTAVIVLREHELLIWAIPPLSSQPPDFFFNHNPTHILPPLFKIPFLDDIAPYSERIIWNTILSWYFGSSHPLYFDMLCHDSKSHRVQFMLNLKPDLSTASLHIINTSEITYDFDDGFFKDYRICENILVSCWSRRDNYECGLYTQLTSARSVNVVSHGISAAKMPLHDIANGCRSRLFLCPASGRFLLLDSNNSVSVLDFF